MKYIRYYFFSILCVGVICYLSFFTPPKVDVGEIPLFDKWVHLVMYGGFCTVIWIEYNRKPAHHHRFRLLIGAIILPCMMSGGIELLQEYATDHRSGDWWDMLANTAGILLAAVLGRWLLPRLLKK